RCVPTAMYGWIHDPPLPFPPDRRVQLDDLARHVHLPYRRPHEVGTTLPRRIFHNEAGREITNYDGMTERRKGDAGLPSHPHSVLPSFRRLLIRRLSKHRPHRERQRV